LGRHRGAAEESQHIHKAIDNAVAAGPVETVHVSPMAAQMTALVDNLRRSSAQ
jgi:hypothetical protein